MEIIQLISCSFYILLQIGIVWHCVLGRNVDSQTSSFALVGLLRDSSNALACHSFRRHGFRAVLSVMP